MLVPTPGTPPPRAFAAFPPPSQPPSACPGPATPASTIPVTTTPAPPPSSAPSTGDTRSPVSSARPKPTTSETASGTTRRTSSPNSGSTAASAVSVSRSVAAASTTSTINALSGPTAHLLDLPLLLQPLHELSLRVVAPQVARRRPPRVDADADHRNLVPHLPRPVRRQQRAEDDPRLERRVVLPAELSQQPQHQLPPLAERPLADPPLALDLLDPPGEVQRPLQH